MMEEGREGGKGRRGQAQVWGSDCHHPLSDVRGNICTLEYFYFTKC